MSIAKTRSIKSTSDFILKHQDSFVFTFLILLSLVLRISLHPFISDDMRYFISSWFDHVNSHGLKSIGENFTNYTPIYSYFLYIATFLAKFLPKTLAIKSISFFFDYVCSFFIFKLIQTKSKNNQIAEIGVFAFLFSPTVIMNGSIWGQIDIIYTTGLIAFIYFIQSQKNWPALVCFGFALATKLQSVFLAPLLLVLFLKRKITLVQTLAIPAAYCALMVPAWLAGRPLMELLGIYYMQFNYFQKLTMNAPNLYQWIPDAHYEIFKTSGLILCASLAAAYSYYVYRFKSKLTQDTIMTVAVTSAIFMPYFLPKMHDRYFFPADVLSLIYVFFNPRAIAVAILINSASIFAYLSYLFSTTVFSLNWVALLPAFALFLLKEFNQNQD